MINFSIERLKHIQEDLLNPTKLESELIEQLIHVMDDSSFEMSVERRVLDEQAEE